jgi:flagellar motor component MotA
VLSLSYEGKEPEEIIKMIEEEIDSIDEENANYDDTPVADRRRG